MRSVKRLQTKQRTTNAKGKTKKNCKKKKKYLQKPSLSWILKTLLLLYFKILKIVAIITFHISHFLFFFCLPLVASSLI